MKVRRPRKKILKMMKVIDTMKWMKGMLVMNLMKMIKVDENDEVNEGENEGGKKPMRLIKVVNIQVRKTIKKNNVDENENDADKYHGHGEYDGTPKK